MCMLSMFRVFRIVRIIMINIIRIVIRRIISIRCLFIICVCFVSS